MEIFREMNQLGYERALFSNNNDAQLNSIIVVHNTVLGPALGGTRAIWYDHEDAAIFDVFRLARGMTYKAALAKVPHGGGKAVIMMPKKVENRELLFEEFGKAVNDLNGLYITTEDSGTSPKDMAVVKTKTKNVVGFPIEDGGSGDPSPFTALGVYRGIQAAAKLKFQRDDLEGLKVALQGVGHVGYPLAKFLYDDGVKLIVTDIDNNLINRAVDELGAEAVSIDGIYDVDCDIFSPCALGATVNPDTIPKLKCKIIAGAANNQLLTPVDGLSCYNKGILYIPDYAINAGGLINVAQEWAGYDEEKSREKTKKIYDTIYEIVQRSEKDRLQPEQITDKIVEERLNEAKKQL